jgi:hypothetical protein
MLEVMERGAMSAFDIATVLNDVCAVTRKT